MSKNEIKFDMISNAKDSLRHAVDHLTSPDGINESDIKIAIREVYHVIELLLKEKLRQIHPAFVWQDIDKYPSKDANTVGTGRAVNRLSRLTNITFDEESTETVLACKKIRDAIEHYEVQIGEKEVKGIIGRMLSFIFSFSKKHLKIDLEKEFKGDDRWEELIRLHEFWEAYSCEMEKQLAEKQEPVYECPYCGAFTFVINEEKCASCGHQEALITCEQCNNEYFESEIKAVDASDEGGRNIIMLCEQCIETGLNEPDFDDMGD
jgi:hypothetical protein